MNTTNDDEKPADLARKPRPVTDDLRAQVKALHAEGLGRNAIAREVQVSGATVTKIAGQFDPPLLFNRESTALALMAKQIDNAEARATLASSFLVRSQQLLDAMDDPVTLGNFGGKDNVWNETLLDAPTIEQQRTLVAAAATAARAATELTRADVAAVGTAAAVGMLDQMRGALGLAVESLQGVDPTVTPEMVRDDAAT